MAKKASPNVSGLAATLKVDDVIVAKLVQLEKTLMAQKAEKLSGKCKVTRQKMRTLRFHRHEHTAETIAQLQKLASA